MYHYTSICGETHGGKSVAALVERNKAKFYGYQTVMESAWSEQALSEYDAAIRQQ
ncbi:hypothetical protein [Kingella sp. (in: b-proteobacteria)]|uniref:hypothetical protein n=1 Tax=Kingella sp. (in: b-proteobacteria) TaxID=2020713 RepID=UPI0026DBF06E|nr:hypothetical protein [Kingella sp. (in: b-proteobacteria)]MDO4658537.1 hypothetical protein [Kingella sp. (in: b-proteobacteria)]